MNNSWPVIQWYLHNLAELHHIGAATLLNRRTGNVDDEIAGFKQTLFGKEMLYFGNGRVGALVLVVIKAMHAPQQAQRGKQGGVVGKNKGVGFGPVARYFKCRIT